VEFPDGTGVTLPGSVLAEPDAVEAGPEWVLCAVKTHQVASAATWLARLCGTHSRVLVLQNGIEYRELVEPLAGPASVVPAVVWFPATIAAPRHVRVHERPRIVVPADSDGDAAVALFDGTRVDVHTTAEFRNEAWRKLCANAVASLMALVERRAEVFHRADMAALAQALAHECLSVARAEGATLPDAVAQETLDGLTSRPQMGTSILTDRLAQRPLEWDARNGVIQRLGAAHGIPTPVSDVVVPLLACCDPQLRALADGG
jgi:2-dehydropantoate 2-reductase